MFASAGQRSQQDAQEYLTTNLLSRIGDEYSKVMEPKPSKWGISYDYFNVQTIEFLACQVCGHRRYISAGIPTLRRSPSNPRETPPSLNAIMRLYLAKNRKDIVGLEELRSDFEPNFQGKHCPDLSGRGCDDDLHFTRASKLPIYLLLQTQPFTVEMINQKGRAKPEFRSKKIIQPLDIPLHMFVQEDQFDENILKEPKQPQVTVTEGANRGPSRALPHREAQIGTRAAMNQELYSTPELLDPQIALYGLRALVVHRGKDAKCGHYYTYGYYRADHDDQDRELDELNIVEVQALLPRVRQVFINRQHYPLAGILREKEQIINDNFYLLDDENVKKIAWTDVHNELASVGKTSIPYILAYYKIGYFVRTEPNMQFVFRPNICDDLTTKDKLRSFYKQLVNNANEIRKTSTSVAFPYIDSMCYFENFKKKILSEKVSHWRDNRK